MKKEKKKLDIQTQNKLLYLIENWNTLFKLTLCYRFSFVIVRVLKMHWF